MATKLQRWVAGARRAVQGRGGEQGNVRSVAVIGAGAAGLVAAREMRREGLNVTCYEMGGSVGGLWVLEDTADSDDASHPLGDSGVHSSIYESLRTNLPREVMRSATPAVSGIRTAMATMYTYSSRSTPFLPNSISAIALAINTSTAQGRLT